MSLKPILTVRGSWGRFSWETKTRDEAKEKSCMIRSSSVTLHTLESRSRAIRIAGKQAIGLDLSWPVYTRLSLRFKWLGFGPIVGPSALSFQQHKLPKSIWHCLLIFLETQWDDTLEEWGFTSCFWMMRRKPNFQRRQSIAYRCWALMQR